MNVIIKYELKKIMQDKTSFISVLLILVVSIVFPFTMSLGAQYVTNYDEATDTTTSVGNLAAIPYLQKAYRGQKGYLTSERFAEIIEKNNTLRNDPKNLSASQIADDDGNITTNYDLNNNAYMQLQDTTEIRNQLRSAFSPGLSYNYYIVDTLKPEDGAQFHQKRNDKIATILNTNRSEGNFTPKEKEIITTMNSSIKEPFYYDYFEGWNILLLNSSGFGVLMTFVCLICLSPVFSGEYQSGNDAILLTTKNGREKLARLKILTGFIFATALYFGCVIVNFIVTVSIHGVSGLNCPIQLVQFTSVYNLNMLQAYLISVLLVYLAMISIISIVLLVSSLFKTSFITVILAAIIFVTPLFIDHSETSRLINYLVTIFPINIMNIWGILKSYTLFNFFGFYLQPIFVYIVVMLALSAICIPFTIRGYKRHQVR